MYFRYSISTFSNKIINITKIVNYCSSSEFLAEKLRIYLTNAKTSGNFVISITVIVN